MNGKLNRDILKDINKFDVEEEISLEDIENIEEFLKSEVCIEPPKELFHNIMDAVEDKIEKEIEKPIEDKSILINAKKLIYYTSHQISLLDKNFWMVSSIILLFGYFFIRDSEYLNLNLMAPFIYGFSIYYLYKGAYYNVFEMELSCKYSMYEMILSRSIIIIIYNIVFISILAFLNYMFYKVNIWAFLIVSWLSPLLVSYCSTLYIFYKKGIMYSVLMNFVIWALYIIVFKSFFYCEIASGVESISLNYSSYWVNINLLIILFFSFIFKNLLKYIKNIYE